MATATFRIVAHGASSPVPLTVGELFETQRSRLIEFSELMHCSVTDWELPGNSLYPTLPVSLDDPEQFANALLNRIKAKKAVATRGFPTAYDWSGNKVEPGLDTFTPTSAGFRNSESLNGVAMNSQGYLTLGWAGLIDFDTTEMARQVRDIAPPRKMMLSMTTSKTNGRMDPRVSQASSQKTSYFFGDSYFFRSAIQPGMPETAKQSITPDGYLRIQGPELGLLEDPDVFETTTKIAIAIANNAALSGELSDIPKRLAPTFRLDGVPIYRHDPQSITPLYWVIEGSLQRPLTPFELERLYWLATRQSALDVPDPITWLIEQAHVFEQLRGHLAPLSDRINVKLLSADRSFP